MTTFVGTQSSFVDATKDLVELDYDAVEAYEAAINRLENADARERLAIFKGDHERHIQELTTLLKNHGEEAPSAPSVGKQWLAKGKVVLANIIGDSLIIKAMISNVEDTNQAYERMNKRIDKWQDADDILKRGLEDERRHKNWLEHFAVQ